MKINGKCQKNQLKGQKTIKSFQIRIFQKLGSFQKQRSFQIRIFLDKLTSAIKKILPENLEIHYFKAISCMDWTTKQRRAFLKGYNRIFSTFSICLSISFIGTKSGVCFQILNEVEVSTKRLGNMRQHVMYRPRSSMFFFKLSTKRGRDRIIGQKFWFIHIRRVLNLHTKPLRFFIIQNVKKL